MIAMMDILEGLASKFSKESIWEQHKRRKTLSFRIYLAALSISTFKNLSERQRFERSVWIQCGFFGGVAIIVMMLFLSFY